MAEPIGSVPRRLPRRGGLASRTALCVVLAFSGCSREPPPAPATALAEPAPALITAAEFVILIDNSASIQPLERVLIREATMLLADLSDEGDRLSVIAFAEDARLVSTRQIVTEEDRRAFKAAVQEGLEFDGQRSDIGAGLQLLGELRQELLPTAGAQQAVIVFSDGLLETVDGRHADALAQIEATLLESLSDLDRYAVVLGNTTSGRTINGLSLTGFELMQTRVASSPSNLAHAVELDELLGVTLMILNRTKGISSLGEEAGATYRIDRTVETMMLIVRKRTSTGVELAESEDIELSPPSTPEQEGEQIRRSTEYTYFDLFIVEDPREGNWSVTLRGGGEPDVLGRIDSPIQLRSDIRARYYVNETVPLAAWLIDEITAEVSRDDYELQARLSSEDGSERYMSFQVDTTNGQYFLDAPRDLILDADAGSNRPQVVEIEILAQRRTASGDSSLDPWFIRRAAPVSVVIAEPLITWTTPGGSMWRLPLRAASVALGGDALEEEYTSLEFDSPPRLTIDVEWFDDDGGLFEQTVSETIDGVREGDRFVYSLPVTLEEYGDYRYRYRLAGNTRRGPVQIESPWIALRVDHVWNILGGVFLVLFTGAHFTAYSRATLRGAVRVDAKGGEVRKHDKHKLGGPEAGRRSQAVFDSSVITLGGPVDFKVKAKGYWKFKHLLVTSGSGVLKLESPKGKYTTLVPDQTQKCPMRPIPKITYVRNVDDEPCDIVVKLDFR